MILNFFAPGIIRGGESLSCFLRNREPSLLFFCYLSSVFRITTIIVISTCLCFVACEEDLPPTHMVQVASQDSLYVVKVPSYMRPGFDMHPFASLQYYDTARQVFVLGMEDAKANLGAIKRRRLKLKGYFNYMETTALERVDSFIYVAGFRDTLPQGLIVQSQDYFALNAPLTSLPLFYRIAVYENDEYFYQMVLWMPYEFHCENMVWLDSMTRSVEFLPPYHQFSLLDQ